MQRGKNRIDSTQHNQKKTNNAQIKLGDDWIAFRIKMAFVHWIAAKVAEAIQVTDQFPLFHVEFISQLAHLFGLFGPSCNVNKIEFA